MFELRSCVESSVLLASMSLVSCELTRLSVALCRQLCLYSRLARGGISELLGFRVFFSRMLIPGRILLQIRSAGHVGEVARSTGCVCWGLFREESVGVNVVHACGRCAKQITDL